MPLINHCNGGGGTPQLCGQVENFKAIRASASFQPCNLSWEAPKDDSFVGVRIVRKADSVPTGINDGTIVYEGTALNYSDSNLIEGTTYYYRAFAYNSKKKYQTSRSIASYVAQSFEAIFAQNSWDNIILACELNIAPNTWEVGDRKTMLINGEEVFVDIIDKNHDTYESGGIAPFTFQLHNCLGVAISWCNEYDNEGLPLLPENVQKSIKAVVKKQLGKDNVVKLFNLTEVEVYGARLVGTYTEGTQYAYYKAGNSKYKISPNENGWWLAANIQFVSNGTYYLYVPHSANSTKASWTSGVQDIAFAFCF